MDCILKQNKRGKVGNASPLKKYFCDKCRQRIICPKGVSFQGDQFIRNRYCKNCYDSKKNSFPISSTEEDWINKLIEWNEDEPFRTETISCIPYEVIFPYLMSSFRKSTDNCVRSQYCPQGDKNYLVYLSRCIRVSKEWQDYFNDPRFWKPVFIVIAVNNFYERKKSLLMAEKKKPLQSSKWTYHEIESNRCKMVIINETKDIPFDIFWITRNEKSVGVKDVCHYKKMIKGSEKYYCMTTYPNARWMCIPTKDWLKKNKYSTLGFTWTIDVFNLTTFKENDGTESLSYVVNIREPNFSKMLPIKDTKKDLMDYRKKIIQLVYNEKDIEYEWGREKSKRMRHIKTLSEIRKEVRNIRNEISISEKKSKDQLYILNMFD